MHTTQHCGCTGPLLSPSGVPAAAGTSSVLGCAACSAQQSKRHTQAQPQHLVALHYMVVPQCTLLGLRLAR